ncbi:hypothetical protein FRC06_001950 [Ceratobasidium sp. 370]|nr:hypothetical protein FRC06_001950 [Ceratobasidium sp. 370]
MLELLQVRIKANPLVLPLGIQSSFSGALQGAETEEREYRPPPAARVLKPWMEDDGRYLLFSLNVNNNHWVAGCANFHDHVIRVGGSLGIFSGIHDALVPLQAWLCHPFGDRFQVEFDLPSGEQEDGVSRGLFSVNTLASYVFNDPALTHQGRNLAPWQYNNLEPTE